MQKLRNNPLIVVLLLLAVITGGVLRYKNKKGTLTKANADFAVADTASITKIFIADKNNAKVLLTRNGSAWKLNGKYEARQDMVDILLTTIKKLSVRAPVPNNTIPGLLKSMATNAKKVEIYAGDEIIKTYYVAGPDMNHAGTYMLLENSTTPYLTHIEGFQGYLTPRYSTIEGAWRGNLLFSLNKKDINEISMNFYNESKNPSYNFHNNNGTYSLMNGNKQAIVFDTLALNMWLNSFKLAVVENFDAGCSKAKTDSILNNKPLYELTIVHNGKEKINIKTFIIKLPKGSTDHGGTPTEEDHDRVYALINNTLPLTTLQYGMLDNFVKPLNYFIPIVKK